MRRLAALLVAISILSTAATAWAADPIRIVAAERVYGDLARQIGGDEVEVTSILNSPNQDPHLFEASPGAARAIADADIVIANGAGYDPWMDRLVSAAAVPGRASIVVAALLGVEDGANPHLWYEPRALPALARALAAELMRRDAADAALFEANLDRFLDSLAPIRARIAAIRAAYAGTPVTATEPIFGYMAEAMGLKMLNGDFQLAVMNGTEPGPARIAEFEAALSSRTARLLLYNAQVSDPTTERMRAIAAANDVPIVGITETEPEGATIQSWFAGELEAVRNALDARR